MTLPLEYNAISMGQVRTELNKASGPISLNDDDVRILFQVSRTSGTIISLHNGHGKSNIMPPSNVVLSAITQTTATVTWKAYQSLVIDGQVDNYQVIVTKLSDSSVVYDSGNLAQSASSANITGLIASAVHSDTKNYRVDVSAKNVSATKTTSVDLLTLENVPLTPSKPVGTVQSSTQISVNSASTYATTYYIYRDGASTPTATVSTMPYVDTVGVYTSHTYTVKGHSTGGDSLMSATSDSVRSLPDAPISAVFTTPSSTVSTLTINWTLSTSPVVNYYQLVVVNFGTTTEVYRKNDVTNTTNTITISTGLAATSKYTATLYTVNESSIFYNLPVSTSEDIWTTTAAPVNAPVVTGVVDTSLGQHQLTVTWTENVTGHTSYNLIRYDVTTPGNASVTLTNVTSPYLDTDLLSYNQYKYTLVSVNAGGSSVASPVSNIVRTLPGPAAVVTNLAVTLPNITSSTATATWTAAIGQVTKYTVNLKQSGTVLESKDVGTSVSATMGQTPFTTTLTANGLYSVSVTTTNENNSITTSDVTFRTKLEKPSSPSVTTLSPPDGRTKLNVSWSAITGATSYNLIKYNNTTSTSETLTGVTTSGTTTLTYSSTGLTSYDIYKYALIAVNDGGLSVASDYSSSVQTLPDDPTVVTGITIPLATITTTGATINWTAAIGQVTKYRVKVVQDTNGQIYLDNTNVSATATSINVTGLASANAHTVTITTYNEASPITGISTSKAFTTKITQPSSPSVTTLSPPDGRTKLNVSWSAITGATSYNLIKYDITTSTSETLTGVTTSGTTTLIYISIGLTSYDSYKYALIAVNDGGLSVASDYSSPVQTLPDDPTVVTGITIPLATITTTGATINWTKATGQVTKYRVKVVQDTDGLPYLDNTNVSATATSINVTGLASANAHTVTITTYNEASPITGISTSKAFTTKITQPSAPIVTSPATAQTSLTITWNTKAGATSHDFKRYTSTGSTLITGISSSPYTDTVVAKTEYWYTLIANNNGGASAESPISNKVTTLADKVLAPAKPTATVTASDSITVSWVAVTGADSYKVYRYPGKTPLGTKTSGFSDTGLAVKTAYQYTVTSVTTGGESDIESAASDSVTTWDLVPGTPRNVATTGITSSSITVTWDAPASGGTVVKYIARRDGFDGYYVFSGDLTATSFKFDNLYPYATFNFIVTAYSTNPNGTASTSVSGATLANAPNKPSTPTTSSVTYNSITVSCNVSQPVETHNGTTFNYNAPMTYTIYRNGTAAGDIIKTGNVTLAASGGTGTVTFVDNASGSVTENTAYTYYVKTANNGGSSTMSDVSVSVTTPYQPPGTPGMITISLAATTSFTASWSAPTTGTATSYKVTVTEYGTTTAVFTASPTSTSVSVNTGLSANKQYGVAVFANNGGGDSATAATTIAITLPPKVTIGTTTSVSTTSLTVNWTAPAGLTLAYSVYRGGLSDSTNRLTTTGSGTSYADTGTLTAETPYYYYVRADNTTVINGVTFGGVGAPSDASTAAYTYPSAPAVPTIALTSTAKAGDRSVTLTITAGSGGVAATAFLYSYGTSVPTSAGTDAGTYASPKAVSVTLGADNTEYYFVATAKRTANGLTSAASTLSSSANYTTPPAAVGQVSVTAATGAFGVKLTATCTSATHFYYKSWNPSNTGPYGSPKFTPPDTTGIGVWLSTDYYLTNTEQYLSLTSPNTAYYVLAVNFMPGTGPATTGGLTNVASWSQVESAAISLLASTASVVSANQITSVTQSVTVPWDATQVIIAACGGGGAGGGSDANAGNKGAGAPRITATYSLPAGTTSLSVALGGGGLPGDGAVKASGGGAGGGGVYAGGTGGNTGPTGTSGGGGGGGGATVVTTIGATSRKLVIAGGGGGGGGGSNGKTGGAAAPYNLPGVAYISASTDLAVGVAGNTPATGIDGGGGGGGGAPYCTTTQSTFTGTGGIAGKDNVTSAGAGVSGGLFVSSDYTGGLTITAAPSTVVSSTSTDAPGTGGKGGSGTGQSTSAYYGTAGSASITFLK
jgi:hypothetical protein